MRFSKVEILAQFAIKANATSLGAAQWSAPMRESARPGRFHGLTAPIPPHREQRGNIQSIVSDCQRFAAGQS
jgi:hypothetical protein